ncbi:MAG TPA: DUF2892 domain-containing protein [Deltaproteobacteria bacterium]|nr:DUF2892 domain-containing protein [Deltaproteobacteria bacterium]
MEQNVGAIDRLSRLVVALAILIVLVKSGKAGLLTALALITSGSLLSSAASGYCSLYTHLGVSTSGKI